METVELTPTDRLVLERLESAYDDIEALCDGDPGQCKTVKCRACEVAERIVGLMLNRALGLPLDTQE